MSTVRLCLECERESEIRQEARTETYCVRGKDYTLDALVEVCCSCNNDLVSERDDDLLMRLYAMAGVTPGRHAAPVVDP